MAQNEPNGSNKDVKTTANNVVPDETGLDERQPSGVLDGPIPGGESPKDDNGRRKPGERPLRDVTEKGSKPGTGSGDKNVPAGPCRRPGNEKSTAVTKQSLGDNSAEGDKLNKENVRNDTIFC